MSKRQVLVIGGGAAGMMAAITAARNGAAVTVLERMDRVGKKLLATGNGRCNLTNLNCDLSHYHGQQTEFARTALSQLPPEAAMKYFAEMGLLSAEEEEARVYPVCGQASAVLAVLRLEMERLGVEVVCQTGIKQINANKKGFQLQSQDGKKFEGQRVVIAAGGKAAPNLGSNGSGYKLLETLGHHCVEPFPALVQLNLELPHLKQLEGVRFNGAAAISDGEHCLRREVGEFLFTSYGISGIPVLQLSRVASLRLSRHEKSLLDIEFFPALGLDDILSMLKKRLERQPQLAVNASLIGLVHKQLIGVVLKAAGIAPLGKPCREVTPEECFRLLGLLHRWRLPVTGTQSWMRAQVTAGGISTAEIDPAAMQSKLVPGLYLAGEIVDIDGDCGGYNLQWAWSSGYLAGLHAAGDE